MTEPTGPILVTGATGAQGGATARRLLAAGVTVRVLTRDTSSAAARALAALGAELHRGGFDDADALATALRGSTGVFSVQIPDVLGDDAERRHGLALVQAAKAAGVQQFVHTSVDRAGTHTGFPRWGSGHWMEKYWTDKWDVEQAVRQAGFAQWTILQPAFMMDNFAQPKSRFMFPHLAKGEIVTALRPDTRMQLIAADDVGAFAAAAFAAPARFSGQTIGLGVESLTMDEVAAVLSRVLGSRITAHSVSADEAIARGLYPGWVRSQEWTNEVGYQTDVEAARAFGVPLTPFADWVDQHRDAIEVPQ